MAPAEWFSVANPVALLGWIALIAGLFSGGRTRAWLLAFGGRAIPLSLSAAYAVALVAYWGTAPGGGFSSLQQVSTLFGSPGVLLAGWIHFLAFDLFIGRWIVDNGLEHGIARPLLLPCLVLTFLVGPVGLLLYFGLRAVSRPGVPSHAR